MATSRPLPPGSAIAILAAARAALRALPEAGAATPATKPVPMAVPAPPSSATGRNAAQQTAAFCKTNPRRAGATPRQMMAARLLLSGCGVTDVARDLGVHPYTVSRWKRNPLFEAELRRQVGRVTPRNAAQQNPTRAIPPAQNKPNRA